MPARLRLVPILPWADPPIELQQGRLVTVGRGPSCDYPLSHWGVSDRHCLISSGSGGRFTIMDLRSFLGTYVNGQPVRPVSPVRLSSGDRVTIGTARYVAVIEPGETGSSTP